MTINIADNTPRKSYTVTAGNTSTSFDTEFEFFAEADLNVYVDGVKKTLSADYTVSGGNGSTGTVAISVTGASGNSTVVLTRSIALERTTDFPSQGAFQITSLNTELDRITAIQADLDDETQRSLRLADDDASVAMTLPLKATRVGTVLGFNASTGAPEAGPTIANVNSLSAITANINTVGGIAANVTTVAGIASNVTTVAGIGATAIGNVSGKATEIGRLGTADAVSDMNTLGTAAIVTDMDTLADISADITTLAHIEDGTDATDAIQTVATNISVVQSASANATAAEAARDSAKAIAAAMGAALDSFDDRYLGTMADSATAPTSKTPTITTTNGSADITVSDATGLSIGMLVTSANIPAGTNVVGISGTTISLNNSATASGSGTSSTFAGFGVFGAFNSSTDGPAKDNDNGTLVTGALYFNTSDNEMRVYDGGNWIAASAAGSASMIIYEYTVSGSATATFTGSDDNGLTLSYTSDNIIVVKDGVTLHDDDYTSTSGTSIVLGSNAAVGSEIVIYAFKSFTVADTVPKSSGGNFLGNIQINGADVATTGKAIAMAIVFGG